MTQLYNKDVQTLGLNIRNERNIKDLFTDNGGQTGRRVYFTHGHLRLYALRYETF